MSWTVYLSVSNWFQSFLYIFCLLIIFKFNYLLDVTVYLSVSNWFQSFFVIFCLLIIFGMVFFISNLNVLYAIFDMDSPG
jgi:hypothetical protein